MRVPPTLPAREFAVEPLELGLALANLLELPRGRDAGFGRHDEVSQCGKMSQRAGL